MNPKHQQAPNPRTDSLPRFLGPSSSRLPLRLRRLTVRGGKRQVLSYDYFSLLQDILRKSYFASLGWVRCHSAESKETVSSSYVTPWSPFLIPTREESGLTPMLSHLFFCSNPPRPNYPKDFCLLRSTWGAQLLGVCLRLRS